MNNKTAFSDERTVTISGQLAMIFLSFTQVGMLVIILYRRYVLDQPEEYYNDLRILLALSVFGFIAIRLLLGVMLPMLSIKSLLGIYFGFVAFLFVTLSIWMGLPSLANWQNTILPVVVGPAIMIFLYWMFAYLGQKQLEKSIQE